MSPQYSGSQYTFIYVHIRPLSSLEKHASPQFGVRNLLAKLSRLDVPVSRFPPSHHLLYAPSQSTRAFTVD